MNGIQGIPVEAWVEIKNAAVALNTGAPQAQIHGSVYIFAAFG